MRLPLIFIIIMMVFALAVDAYIVFDIVKGGQKRRNTRRWIYAATCIPFYGLIIALFFMPVRSENQTVLPVMWIVYTIVSFYAAKLGYVILSALGRLISLFRKNNQEKIRKNSKIAGIVAAIIIFVVLWIGVGYTRHRIEVNHVTVESAKLPKSFDGYRIVQFSDAHVGTWGNDTTFISSLVDSINAQHPDMIVFTGDLVNRETSELKPFLNVLSRLEAPDGVYSVLGNHDYGDYMDWKNPEDREKNNRQLARWQKEMGWDLLNNEYRVIRKGDETISLIGVENWGEPPFGQYGDLNQAYGPSERYPDRNLKDSTYKILLSHNPEHWVEMVRPDSNIDLTLSGHTHAMQMMVKLGKLRWSPSAFKYSTWGGLYEGEDRDAGEQLYVNIGAGEVGMPARLLNAYPEVAVLDLKRKE